MPTTQINIITLWRMTDWGFYDRRDEALLRELSRREAIEKVLHVEHVTLRELLSFVKQWLKAKNQSIKQNLLVHVIKGFSLVPIRVRGEKNYYLYSVICVYSGSYLFLRKISALLQMIQYRWINSFMKDDNQVLLMVYPPLPHLPIAVRKIKHHFLFADVEDDEMARAKNFTIKKRHLRVFKEILPQCNSIFSTSPNLVEKYARFTKQKIAYLPNGVYVNRFLTRSSISTNGRRKRVGYVGVLNVEVDMELVEHLLSKFPEVEFVFIGYATDERRWEIKKLQQINGNLQYLGPRNYLDIPGEISGFDVLLNIKKADHTTMGNDLQKIYDYLATGKPVVSTPVAPADRFGEIIYLAVNKFEFAQQLHVALEEDNHALRKKRIQAATENSWSRRADVLMNKIGELLNTDSESD